MGGSSGLRLAVWVWGGWWHGFELISGLRRLVGLRLRELIGGGFELIDGLGWCWNRGESLREWAWESFKRWKLQMRRMVDGCKQSELERPELRELAWETWDLSFNEWERVNETGVSERMNKKRSKLYQLE